MVELFLADGDAQQTGGQQCHRWPTVALVEQSPTGDNGMVVTIGSVGEGSTIPKLPWTADGAAMLGGCGGENWRKEDETMVASVLTKVNGVTSHGDGNEDYDIARRSCTKCEDSQWGSSGTRQLMPEGYTGNYTPTIADLHGHAVITTNPSSDKVAEVFAKIQTLLKRSQKKEERMCLSTRNEVYNLLISDLDKAWSAIKESRKDEHP
ncbi:hypothetical protein ZIOFF_026528 [Zingiber officinale]|uniref:Uncharacterized protein n=1 Tax=Zingiber officinale TaxID=94328 RepID=A0A8J5HGQ7_ZINOF|nr:hypothetical protein ZIOFF_026528 [Zingiber officinale]